MDIETGRRCLYEVFAWRVKQCEPSLETVGAGRWIVGIVGPLNEGIYIGILTHYLPSALTRRGSNRHRMP